MTPRERYRKHKGTYQPTFRKRLASGLTAYRSAEDGMWRVWGPLSPAQLGLSDYPEGSELQVCLGVHYKLAEAHLIAKGKN